MHRRDFLRSTGYFFVVANASSLLGCSPSAAPPDGGGADGGGGDGGPSPGVYRFAQGVGSGDPREGSVVLWTRAERIAGGDGAIGVTAEVATDEAFQSIVATKAMEAGAESDYTVRLVVAGLSPATTYWYRFRAGADASRMGRTRTAPARDADVPVVLAWASCQDLLAGFHGAWRRMVNDDRAAKAEDQIAAVGHGGDFIYETVGDGFQQALDENLQPVALVDAQGKARAIAPLPDGGTVPGPGGAKYAKTLADYRHLYRAYLGDPDLQEARARWPFICTWDDHEFTDDAWQTQANYDDLKTDDEPMQKRKLAANRAWFEYQPVQLTDAPGVPGVTQRAKDFTDVKVEDAPYSASDVGEDLVVREANNVAALGSMTIYRSFRFGKHVELAVTDLRSYRSDHPVVEETSKTSPFFFAPRNATPADLVKILDAGRTANGGNPPDLALDIFPNTRKAMAPGTLMGPTQKTWWKETMKGSDATWRLWASSVPVMRMMVDVSATGILPFDLLVSSDAWDGYPSERAELMKYLTDNSVRNVVVLSGDLHAHFAGLVEDDPDAATRASVATEFVAGAISSNTLFSFYEEPTRAFGGVLRDLVTYDATKLGGTEKFVRNFNTALRWGVTAASTAAMTNDAAKAEAARNPKVNPHLSYVDTDARGYGLLRVSAGEVKATLVTVPAPIQDKGVAGAEIAGKVTFTVPAQKAGEPASMSAPVFEGKKPWPLK